MPCGYLLRLDDARHRPAHSIQDALEAQVSDGGDLAVVIRDQPLMIAANGVSVASYSAPLPCPRQARCRRRNADSRPSQYGLHAARVWDGIGEGRLGVAELAKCDMADRYLRQGDEVGR